MKQKIDHVEEEDIMPSSEDLARFVAANTDIMVDAERSKGAGYLVPPPPKPGEVIICQQCGRPMYPEDFNSDPKIRRHEFKWHMHWECEQQIWDLVDRQTPGLMAERKGGVPKIEKPVSLGRNSNRY
jgi:hypothetical protein